MSQTILVKAGVTVADIAADLGGWGAQNDAAELIVRFIGADKRAAVDGAGESFFFRGDVVQRYAHAASAAEAPVARTTFFPDLGSGAIDAAVKWDATHAYFFRGSEVIYWDFAAVAPGHPRGRKVAGYPKTIASEWPGLAALPGGARDVTSVILWPSGNVYVFKGGDYMRMDKSGNVAAGYPRVVSTETWPGLFIDGFYGALQFGQTNKYYFFREDGYLRYDATADKVDDGYPLSCDASTWPGLTEFWSNEVRLGPVLAAERGSLTKLIHKEVRDVAVPAGARAIGVELVFRREGEGDNDASADNVSIVLR
jgi:hypothetical protein